VNFDVINGLIATLGTMKYFPSDLTVRLALVELMGELTDDENAVRWLVKEMRTKFQEWPGEFVLRQTFIAKFRPRDGVVYSVCTCGCGAIQTMQLAPGQQWPLTPQITTGAPLQLAQGPICEESQAAVAELAAKMPKLVKPMKFRAGSRGAEFAKLLEETITASCDRPDIRKLDTGETR
jgi:hypothetical protein